MSVCASANRSLRRALRDPSPAAGSARIRPGQWPQGERRMRRCHVTLRSCHGGSSSIRQYALVSARRGSVATRTGCGGAVVWAVISNPAVSASGHRREGRPGPAASTGARSASCCPPAALHINARSHESALTMRITRVPRLITALDDAADTRPDAVVAPVRQRAVERGAEPRPPLRPPTAGTAIRPAESRRTIPRPSRTRSGPRSG